MEKRLLSSRAWFAGLLFLIGCGVGQVPRLQISFSLDLFRPGLCFHFQPQPIPCSGLHDLRSCGVDSLQDASGLPLYTLFLVFGQSVFVRGE